jgi:hypothetical protein
MLKAVLIALAIAASSAMAAENDEDYKAEAAIRGCQCGAFSRLPLVQC